MPDPDERISPADTDEPATLTLTQARELLHIGHTKMTQLIKAGKQTNGSVGLPSSRSTLDRRTVLVKRSDVEALRAASQGVSVEDARKQLDVGRTKMYWLLASGGLIVRPNPLNKQHKFVDAESLQRLLTEKSALSSPKAHDA